MSLIYRPRRLRTSSHIRSLIAETSISTNDLIAPLFVMEGNSIKTEIESMPGQYRWSLDLLLDHISQLREVGIKAIALFPVVDESLKTKCAKEAINPEGLNQKAIKAIKRHFPDLLVMSDVALDPYNSDGHDGLVDAKTGEIKNDETLELLSMMALIQAKAGSDIIGPSDMMDGRVASIRKTLDAHDFHNTLIMSYTAKYSSSFYGPFRDALDSAPKNGDKKTYQMDYLNAQEAIRELRLDEKEGADIIMVKPGLSYLDVIYRLKQASNLPIAAYNVSGEYAMIMAAHKLGYVDKTSMMVETLSSFKRAGADLILTYFAYEMANYLKDSV